MKIDSAMAVSKGLKVEFELSSWRTNASLSCSICRHSYGLKILRIQNDNDDGDYDDGGGDNDDTDDNYDTDDNDDTDDDDDDDDNDDNDTDDDDSDDDDDDTDDD